jgi:hypothetical protein
MYIDQTMNPYGLLCSTHVIKFNTLLSLLKVFDFDLIVLPLRTLSTSPFYQPLPHQRIPTT